MKQLRQFPQAVVSPKAARSIEHGHPWVYASEVRDLLATPLDGRAAVNGDVVDVVDEKGGYLGTGLISEKSTIRIRIISRNANDRFDEAFWERKARWAWEYRKAVMASGDERCCRVVFSEADSFGGFTCDRYENVLVCECTTVGMDRLAPVVAPAVAHAIEADGDRIDGIYLKNDARVREKEGLPLEKGWLEMDGRPAPESTTIQVRENGVVYEIDLANSQKTGLFLDQKYNRQAVARLAQGRRVLDCFTHVGTFALNAAVAGAQLVHGVDVSASAIDAARRNASLNGVADRSRFTCANVFDFLPALEADHGRDAGGPFDLIVVDPPAFTKSRKTIHEATRGYRQVNYRAMRLLPRGGFLATCSCSHFLDEKLMRDVVAEAAHDAGVQLRQVEARQQAPDHPIVWGIPETSYLKFFIFQVV